MSRYDKPSHRIYMTFLLRKGWQAQFCEANLKRPCPQVHLPGCGQDPASGPPE